MCNQERSISSQCYLYINGRYKGKMRRGVKSVNSSNHQFLRNFKKKKRKKKKHPIWSPNDSGTTEYWVVFLFYMKDGKIKIDLARFCSWYVNVVLVWIYENKWCRGIQISFKPRFSKLNSLSLLCFDSAGEYNLGGYLHSLCESRGELLLHFFPRRRIS